MQHYEKGVINMNELPNELDSINDSPQGMSKKKAVILYSKSTNPWHNLAVEEYLMEYTSLAYRDGMEYYIMYLWQNKDTVVIGRNQNAWGECRTGLLAEDNGVLARRSTGGGAVFHDMGNLNFSFITPKIAYDTKRSSQVILNAVKSLGVDAYLSGRNDILAEEKKFSGNAFCVYKEAGLHHGTLLINSDYARIAKYLEVSKAKLDAKGIKSVKSRVTNLSAIVPKITLDTMKLALEKYFLLEYPVDAVERYEDTSWIENSKLEAWIKKHESWDWQYGQTLKFTAKIETRFDWGGFEMQFLVNEGKIIDIKIFTDALDLEFFEKLEEKLKGVRFLSSEIISTINDISKTPMTFGASREIMIKDIVEFINEQKL